MISRAPHGRKLKRRQLISGLVGAGYSLLLAACLPKAQPNRLPTPAITRTVTPTTFLPDTPTSVPSPTVTPTRVPAPWLTPTISPSLAAATARADNYDQAHIRVVLESMLDRLGGFGNLVRPGSRVGLKVNLTGGPWSDGPGKPKAVETYATHPAVLGALCELLKDAGAARLTIMDGLGDETTFDKWGYTDMAKPLSLGLLNLCKPDPYADYIRFPVGQGHLVYDFFWLNPMLAELDVFISVAKLKCHSTAGVTLTLKNLIGLTPIEKYKRLPVDTNRSALHNAALYAFDNRLPKVIIDLNRARRVDFALIDGIHTVEGGAGPWEKTLNPVAPGVLVAGFNPVVVDAVATALMGFDPEAVSGSLPFLHGDNHLALASQAGLGTHHLADIQVLGPEIQDLKFPFKPAP